MDLPVWKRASALLPVIMSLFVVGMVVAHYAMYGIVEETDEGTPAHIFQLLMVAQIPLIGFFIMKWLPEEPAQGAKVLALQLAAAVAAFASVYFLTGG
jgi:hypothetical protein